MDSSTVRDAISRVGRLTLQTEKNHDTNTIQYLLLYQYH